MKPHFNFVKVLLLWIIGVGPCTVPDFTRSEYFSQCERPKVSRNRFQNYFTDSELVNSGRSRSQKTESCIVLTNCVVKSDKHPTKPLPCRGKVRYFIDSWKIAFDLELANWFMDEQATFSVTVAGIARLRDEEILMNRHRVPKKTTILDGMACVGGDSLSFMYHFVDGQVISNEIDYRRFGFLEHNMRLVRKNLAEKCAAQVSRMGSVLRAWDNEASLIRKCDMLYLDPEWGGLDYRTSALVSLNISGVPLHECVLNAFCASDRLRWVVLKLPFNFDTEQISIVLDNATSRGVGVVSAHKYRMMYRGQCRMIFVVLERFEKNQSPAEGQAGASTSDAWRKLEAEEIDVTYLMLSSSHASSSRSSSRG